MMGALLVGFFGAFAPLAANAGTASGGVASFTVNGKLFSDQSTVDTISGQATASTNLWTGGSCMTFGDWGTQARLLNSTGSLAAGAAMAYAGGCSTWSEVSKNAHGTFFSYGVVAVWNGSSYVNQYALPSPQQSS